MSKQILLKMYRLILSNLAGYGLSNIGFVRYFNNLFIHKFKLNSVEVMGNKIFLDDHDSLRLSILGVHEPYQTEIIMKNVKRGDVVLDVGANIGYYTLLFAKLVGPEGIVFAFEPDPTNFSILKKNVETNNYTNVRLVNKAVTDRIGKSCLYLCKDNTGDHRIYNAEGGRDSVEVETIDLDGFFNGFRKEINFVKMDIQGAESKAIFGMHNLIDKNKRVKIMMEFWPEELKKTGISPSDHLSYLVSSGFELYNVNKKKGIYKVANVSNLDKHYTFFNKKFGTILCLKKND